MAYATILLSLLFADRSPLANEAVKIEAVPAWTEALDLPQPSEARADQVRGGMYFLLQDKQFLPNATGYDGYFRNAYRVTDRSGLEQAASIQTEYDPKTTTLAFNFIHIIRDGKVIDALDGKDIVVLHREQQLEKGVFDGYLTAHTELKNLQVGDTVDYALTTHVATPLWPGQFFRSSDVAWSVPLTLQRFRLIWPDDRSPLYAHFTHGEIAGHITQEAHRKIHEWRLIDPDPVPGEKNVPNGLEVYNRLELSTFQSWRDVSRWVFRFYDKPNPFPDWFAGKVDAIKAKNPDPADRITQAMRLVEDTIRYVSIAINPGGYIPRPAATIVTDGFGDCKDKSTLLVAILRSLGVEAYPALTLSDDGWALATRLPHPSQFDHMIVLVRYQGRDYWIDPTHSHQGGRFPKIWYPDYGYALPIMEAGSDLLPVVYPKGPEATVTATEHFAFDPNKANYTLSVDTIYREDEADGIRVKLANRGREKFNKDNLDFYQKKYPDLKTDEPAVIRDDREFNQISVTERYRFASGMEEFNKYTPFLPSYMRGYFDDLPGNRTYPYALNDSTRIHETVLIESPGVDIVDYDDQIIENPQFSSSRTVSRKPGMLSLAYGFRIKDRQVPLADYSRFRADADSFNNLTYPSISLKNAQSNSKRRDADQATAAGIGTGFVGGISLLCLIPAILGARFGLKADRDYADKGVYFPVGLRKFILLNLITFGSYGTFWIWKCWRWVKTRDEADILPFWRAIFVVFWWDALFENIRRRDIATAFPRWVGLLTWALFVGMSVATFLPVVRHHGWLGLVLQMLGLFCLIPTVVTVNRLNAADDTALVRNSRINRWNIVGIVVGSFVLALSIFGYVSAG
jgi:transglutaminase-like putative cysteine protease